jgi:polyhydroxyalkanoate synthesis regulator protein
VFGSGNQAVEQLARQNMAMFEQSMQMLTPFAPPQEPAAPAPAADLDDLKTQMEEMRRQLAELSQRK